jgi:hypothetical protein
MSMVIERSGFLVAATALAAGGLGGWLAHESKFGTGQTTVAPPAMTSAAPAPSPPTVLVVEHVTPPPACDDSTGSVEDCPVIGPSDEGVCNLAARRCADFKVAFKPKVAQAAVACLRRLKGKELCDPARVNGCGHSALMAACQDPVPSPAASDTALAAAPPSVVTSSCEGILKGCSSEPLAPTMSDCRQTLSGMSDTGRANMMACVSAHCRDRGLLGCEAKKD